VEKKEKVSNKKRVKPEDLDWELLNKEVELVLKSGEVLRGRVVSTSSYWLKIESSNATLHINKPSIVYVRVLEGRVERPSQAPLR
jgi:small nuclear ribonucleoprotein (snRNP)-like protein